MEKRVLMEACAEVTSAMREGVSFPTEHGSKDAHDPFSQLSRREKVGLLNRAVDWPLYSHYGLRPGTGAGLADRGKRGGRQAAGAVARTRSGKTRTAGATES